MKDAIVRISREDDYSFFQQALTMGDIFAKSNFFNDSRGAAQAVTKIMAGRELGFSSISSMTGINIINGKISLSANMMAAIVRRSGTYDYEILQLDDTICSIEFSRNEKKLKPVVTFTMDQAKRIVINGKKLVDKENWINYPQNMLFARAMSNGFRFHCPDLSGGSLYTQDELESDFVIRPQQQEQQQDRDEDEEKKKEAEQQERLMEKARKIVSKKFAGSAFFMDFYGEPTFENLNACISDIKESGKKIAEVTGEEMLNFCRLKYGNAKDGSE